MIISNQNDQIIEEIKERLGKKRKRALTYNLLLSLCLCLVIIGFIGTIHFYRKVKKSELKIIIQKDSLEQLSVELEKWQHLNKISEKKRQSNDSLLIKEFKRNGSKNIKPILNNISISSDSAHYYAQIGYNKLKHYDFIGAKDAFAKSEKSYSGYRDSYEVYMLLWKNRNSFDNPVIQKQIIEKIFVDYNSLGILKKTDIK